jgi:hypothetical protein
VSFRISLNAYRIEEQFQTKFVQKGEPQIYAVLLFLDSYGFRDKLKISNVREAWRFPKLTYWNLVSWRLEENLQISGSNTQQGKVYTHLLFKLSYVFQLYRPSSRIRPKLVAINTVTKFQKPQIGSYVLALCVTWCHGYTEIHGVVPTRCNIAIMSHWETVTLFAVSTLSVVQPVPRLYSVHAVRCGDVWEHNDLQEGRSYVTARLVTPTGQYSHALLCRRKVALLVNSVRTCLIVGQWR